MGGLLLEMFGRDIKMCLCALWSAGDTACLPSPGKSFPCFSTIGIHLSPRIPALLELPKLLRRSQGMNQLLERQKNQERQPKRRRQCYVALAQTLMAIQNISSTPTVCPAFVKNGTLLWNWEKVDPQNTMSAIFSLCYYEGVTNCSRWRFILWTSLSPSPSFLPYCDSHLTRRHKWAWCVVKH